MSLKPIKIFLSSRVNSSFRGLDKPYSLKELRAYIRTELEAQLFLGQQVLEVVINESNFNATIAKNAFDECMETMRDCNIIIILYNGEAGWSIAGINSTNGICHEEFLIAMEKFSDMSFILNLSGLFTLPPKGEIFKKNQAFTNDISESFPHMEAVNATSVEELKLTVLTQVKQYVLAAIDKSFRTQKAIVSGSGVFGDTLDWSKLSYSEREMELLRVLKPAFEDLAGFQDVIKAYHAVPDNMSVAEARNVIGRPFLNEHTLIAKRKLQAGIIHFVAVYGNATEIQVKNLVGYPDLTVIKASFGYYLWEQHMHIQIFFLNNCINPQTVRTRFSEVSNWLTGSREKMNIISRAQARYSILEVVNKVSGVK